MKVLYISPENTVGTLDLWKKAHEARGNQCTFVTLYPTKHSYDPGICLNLPLVNTSPFYMKIRHRYYQIARGIKGDYREKEGYPPVWKPNSKLEKWYFQFRDWLWHFKVEDAIKDQNLLNYDIYHLEWGLEFYRDGRFVKKLKEAGLPPRIMIDCSHGNSNKDFNLQPIVAHSSIDQVLDYNQSIIGFMLESNIKEGNQQIPEDLSDLKYGVSLTDACMNWETTETLLSEAAERLRSR